VITETVNDTPLARVVANYFHAHNAMVARRPDKTLYSVLDVIPVEPPVESNDFPSYILVLDGFRPKSRLIGREALVGRGCLNNPKFRQYLYRTRITGVNDRGGSLSLTIKTDTMKHMKPKAGWIVLLILDGAES
jgi:hypothetical protein